MGVLMVVYGVVLVLFFCIVALGFNKVRYGRKGLPPGTMGWPLFGETIAFLTQGPMFLKMQRARYGYVFKTHIFGSPTVISMDPELNRYILLNEGKGLIPGYPQSMLDILGTNNIAAVDGSVHKYLRGALLSLICKSKIRDQLLTEIDKFMKSHLTNWNDQIINIQDKTKEMAYFSSVNQLGLKSRALSDAYKEEFADILRGVLSLPINLPGTNYYRGIEARKSIVSILREIFKERRMSAYIRTDDMLDSLLKTDDNSLYKLNDEEIIDLLITFLYSGFETVSTTSMMVVKYLHDHPKALQELREEHMEIRKGKTAEDVIDWKDYKSMNFTRAVIYETMRLSTVTNGVMRKTTKDIELKGFVIPKGWRMYVYTRENNYDPFLYPDPLTFNPWRWQGKSLESSPHFLIFGAGTRLCPGKELGVVEISTFIHYFVTRYRWEEVRGEKV